MAKVTIYTIPQCPYCIRAKQLLTKKGVKFTDIDVENDDAQWDSLVKKTKCETVPQIFINDTFIGGCDQLMALEKEKKLDALLK